MRITIKGAVKVLTFAVFLITLISAYFLYTSYNKYKESQELVCFINLSDKLSNLVINLANEEVKTDIYNHYKIPLLRKQMLIARKNSDYMINRLPNNAFINSIKPELKKLRSSNSLQAYKQIISKILDYQKSQIMNSYNKELKTELNLLLILNKAINKNIIENGTISYYILTDKPIPHKKLKWLETNIMYNDSSLNLDILNFDPYKGINKLRYNVNLNDLVENRNNILYSNLNYYDTDEFDGYTIDILDWNEALTTHISILNKIKNNLKNYIIKKANEEKDYNFQILIISLILFIFSILLQIGSYFIEKGIEKSNRTLSELLTSLAAFIGIDKHIDIATAEGQDNAYHIIQSSLEKLKEEKEMADKENKAKSTFLANMSHEIRTPMNGVLGFIELLKLSKLDKTQLEYINTIEMSAKNLLILINQILDISKIESDKMELFIEEFDTCKEIRNTVNIFSVRATQQNLDYAIFIDPKLPKVIKADVLKVKEILTNLINNAIKFTEKGGVSVYIILKRIKDNKAKIYFEVSDTGIGLTPAQIKKIFEPFTQADSSTTKKYGGTGLGMTIVSKYIEMMGGEIQVESQYKKGSKFYFDLEFEVVDENSCISDKLNANIDLLVDDSMSSKSLLFYLDKFGVRYRLINNLDEVENEILFISKKDFKVDENQLKNIKYWIFKNVDYNVDEHTINYPLFPIILFKTLQHIISKHTSYNASPFKNKRALIVEDNQINQNLMRIILRDLEIKTDIASNGLEALELFDKNRYDFIFMDLSMPEMDGYEATKRIREIEKDKNLSHTPIIALTSNVLEEDRKKFFEVGGDEFLAKPTTQSILIVTISKILKGNNR